MTNPTSQSGFTLLEVMIALVIFSIGLLGLSGLQAISLQNNQVAYSRTVATMLAYDLADRIRNNEIPATVAIPGAAPTSCIGAAANCNSAAMRSFDLWEWNQTVQAAQNNLTNARGFITRTGTTYTVAIGWDENRAGVIPTGCSPAAPAGVACVSIVVEP